MVPSSLVPTSVPRAATVLLCLVANLVAAGVPVLHALAHDLHHHHDEAGLATLAELDHQHDEVHPLALHDEGLGLDRTAFHLPFGAPPVASGLLALRESADKVAQPVAPVSSRAPPRPGRARAPPIR